MIKIRRGDIIKHDRFMDVCLKVNKVFDYGHGIKLVGTWYNQGYVNSYSLNMNTSYDIAKRELDIKGTRGSSLKEWSVLSPECKHDSCYRRSAWLRIDNR